GPRLATAAAVRVVVRAHAVVIELHGVRDRTHHLIEIGGIEVSARHVRLIRHGEQQESLRTEALRLVVRFPLDAQLGGHTRRVRPAVAHGGLAQHAVAIEEDGPPPAHTRTSFPDCADRYSASTVSIAATPSSGPASSLPLPSMAARNASHSRAHEMSSAA